MNRFTYAEFLDRRDDYDAAVAETPEIASFCSSFLWQTAAHDSMQSPGEEDEHFIIEKNGTWLSFAEREKRRIFYPLEACWMFGSPLIGDPAEALELLKCSAAEHLSSPVGFCFGGVRKEGLLHQMLKEKKQEFFQWEEFPATDCMEIDLADGFDAWMSRRSKRFRKSMGQLELPEGWTIEDASGEDAELLIERLQAIQRQSYKSREGGDIFSDSSYLKFYRTILEDLHARKGLRFLFARNDGEDMAYIFGGVQRDIYRGFQMSYVDSVRESGIGNLLQIENLRARADEGIQVYDLGMHSPYKERWADRWEKYVGLFLVL